MPDYTTAALILVAMVAWKIIEKLVDGYWNKTVASTYMTTAACEKCREGCKAKRGVKDEDLIKLVRTVRDEMRRMNNLFIKYMVYSGASAETIEEALEIKVGGTD
jgi:hypothetical protein